MGSTDALVGFIGALVLVASIVGVTLFNPASSGELEAASPDAPDVASLAKRVNVPFVMEDCALVEGFIQVDPALVRPHVPADFDLASSDPAGPVTGLVTVAVGGLTCGTGGTDGETGPVGKAWFHALVTPKDAALRADHVDFYYYRLDHYVNDDVYAATLAGLGDEHVIVDTIRTDVAPTGSTLTIASGDWQHRVSVNGGPFVPSAAVGGAVGLRQFGPNGGDGFTFIDGILVMGETVGRHPGTFEVDAGSRAAALVGASGGAEVLHLDGFHFEELTVGFVPRSE